METINQPPAIQPRKYSLLVLLLRTMLYTKAKNMLVLIVMIFRVIIHISTGEGNMLDLMLELAWTMIIGNVLFLITGMFTKSVGVDMSARTSFIGVSGFALIIIYPVYNRIILENVWLTQLLLVAIALTTVWYLIICMKELDWVTYLMGPEPEKEKDNYNQETNNSLNV